MALSTAVARAFLVGARARLVNARHHHLLHRPARAIASTGHGLPDDGLVVSDCSQGLHIDIVLQMLLVHFLSSFKLN